MVGPRPVRQQRPEGQHGCLSVVDRIMDMIAVVGGHVCTTGLEDYFNTHPVTQPAV
ncbi:hypothetical protein [Streptomyces sp. NPDC088719]|uniref:hypothetical protein n=1 Tax=Streptomyces sp. NPDC088719 TaxID=3365872 RepID=UPI0037F1628E